MLNILYVGTLPPHPGGTAVSCAQLLVGFVRFGHAVRAVAPITPEALSFGDRFAASHPGMGITRFLLPQFDIATCVPLADDYRRAEHEQIRQALSVLIENERPDVIVIGRETFARHVPELARAYRLPCLLMSRTGNLIRRILDGIYPEDLARQLVEQLRAVDLIVVQARHMAVALQQLGCSRIAIIPNSIDVQQFLPKTRDDNLARELPVRSGDIIVVHLSNLTAAKRPLDIVNSAERALDQNPRLLYVIVGDGPYRERMEEACRRHHITERFRFTGWVDYDRVQDYVNLADIVVMPSEAESQARVYLEAQACARVLVASDIPGAREVIEDGETGLLFRKGDIDDLTTKTLLAASDPELRARIGRSARLRVQTHSIDYALAAYIAVFEGIVRQCSG